MTGRPVLVVDDHNLFAETLLVALRAADVLSKSASLDEVVTVTRRAAAGQPVAPAPAHRPRGAGAAPPRRRGTS
ncbi:MAG: hypothetical protein ACOYXW_11515 [Actinomycetota bacterium]